MTLRITTRLTLWYLVFFGSAIVMIAVSRHLLFVWGEKQHLDDQGKSYAGLLLSARHVWEAPLPLLITSLDSLSRQSELQYRSLRFFLHDGRRVLYDNAVPGVIPPLLDSLRVRIDGRKGFNTLQFNSGEYRVYTASSMAGDGRDIRLTIVIPQEELDATLKRLRIFLVIGIVLLLTIAWIGGSILTRRSLAMVEQLRRTAAEITGTNLARRVPVGKAQDELTALARTFNEMIKRLERFTQSHRQFVTNTSHDLRTPLTTLRTELQMAMEEESASSEIREAVRRCLKQIDRLDRLTADLMFLARVDADGLQLTLRKARLDELLLECAADIRTSVQQKGMAVDVTLPAELPVECVCDEHLVRRAVMNLLDNAVHYSPSGSTIRVMLERTETEARIIVADNGPGMEEEESRRAVERLYRGPASRSTSGSGLGLTIVAEIVATHNGRLHIDSVPGKGTTVTLIFPLPDPAATLAQRRDATRT